MPDELIVVGVKVKCVEDGLIGIGGSQLFAPMFLRNLESRIGIDFEKLCVKDVRAGIAGVVSVIRAVRDTTFRRVRAGEAAPCKRFAQLLGGRGEVSPPQAALAFAGR